MANFMKRNGKWQARVSWRDADGKLHQKSKAGFATKAQAKLYAAELESELGKGVDVSADPVFADYFEQWYKTYREPHLRPGSKSQYTAVILSIKKYFKKTKLKSINRSMYQQAINAYGANHSKGTVQRFDMFVKSCVRSAIADGIITRDFTYGAKLPFDESKSRHVEYLSVAELKQLVKTLENDLPCGNIAVYVILTAIYTGARFGEILALQWDDIDFERKTISITKTWDQRRHIAGPPKTPHSIRTIRVNIKLLKWLKQLYGNSQTMIFVCSKFDGDINYKVNSTLSKYLQKAGLKKQDFHLHSLRHTHVAYLLSQGVDLYAISKRLGHANMGITSNIYAYFIDEYKRKSDDQIESKLDEI